MIQQEHNDKMLIHGGLAAANKEIARLRVLRVDQTQIGGHGKKKAAQRRVSNSDTSPRKFSLGEEMTDMREGD